MDSSPLIILGKVRRLDLLAALYEDVVVPPAVADEVVASGRPATSDLQEFVEHHRGRPVKDTRLAQTLALDLGRGEAQAIALAAEIGGSVLVMDDFDGRRVARGLELQVTGVLGVLMEAKYRGIVSSIRPILDAMTDEGFWLGESAVRNLAAGLLADAARQPNSSSADGAAVAEFAEKLRAELGAEVTEMRLFGSKATGQAVFGSDIDVLVVVRDARVEIEDRVIATAFDVNLVHDVYISPRVVSQATLEHPVWRITPFLRAALAGTPV